MRKDPGETANLFKENKELGRQLFAEMETVYKALGELPPSIVLRTPADESHFEYLGGKRKD